MRYDDEMEAAALHSLSGCCMVSKFSEKVAGAGSFWETLLLFIAIAESWRAQVGWTEPYTGNSALFSLRPDYTPGDIGYDPLGIKPTDPAEFAEMQTKEINNGRLAMVGAAGMIVQELIDGKTILSHLN